MTHDSVSSSLLVRLRGNDPVAWERLVKLYLPVVYDWCRQANLSDADAADVVQEAFAAVARSLPNFRRERVTDTFQGWLATITRNKIRDHYRAASLRVAGSGGTDAQLRLLQATEPEFSTTMGSDRSQKQLSGVLRRAAHCVQAEFEPKTWTAFWRTAVDGRTPKDASRELGVSVNSVYKARSRVLRRLREELEGLL